MSRSRATGPRPVGNIDGPTGSFRLAAGLPGPGAITIPDAAELVIADWEQHFLRGQLSRISVDAYTDALRRFVMYATALGVLALADIDGGFCQKWCTALKATGKHAPRASQAERSKKSSLGTRYSRRSVLRAFFLTCYRLGLEDRDPSVGVALPARAHTRWLRALTDAEVRLALRAAQRTVVETRHPVTVALALRGLTTAELPAIRVRDCWPEQLRVWAHGGATRTAARWVVLDQHTAIAITRRIEFLARTVHPDDLADTPLIYSPKNPNSKPQSRQAAASNQLIKVLRQAGLGQDETLHAGAFAAHAAKRLYEQTGDLRKVAAALGLLSLDTTAEIVGLDWRHDCRVSGPPGVPTPNTPFSYAGVPRPGDDAPATTIYDDDMTGVDDGGAA